MHWLFELIRNLVLLVQVVLVEEVESDVSTKRPRKVGGKGAGEGKEVQTGGKRGGEGAEREGRGFYLSSVRYYPVYMLWKYLPLLGIRTLRTFNRTAIRGFRHAGGAA